MMKKLVLLAPAVLVLTACGGGGGGSASSNNLYVRWDNTSVSGTVSGGISNEVDYTYNTSSEVITSLSNLSAGATGATLTATYDSSNDLGTATLTSAGGTTLSWNTATDSYGTLRTYTNIEYALSADGEDYALIANPFNLNFDYQTFGTWVTGAGTGSGDAGNFSFGYVTTGSNIPTSGSATYTGYTGGRYSDSSARDYFISANLSATANFATRSVAVTTSNTYKSRNLVTDVLDTNINMTGTMTYAAATNNLTGTFSTADSRLSGTMKGQFYGPTANEIGGTFSAVSGTEGIFGAFGAKQ